MGEFENKSSFGEGKAEMSVELIDSLGEWALREGYSHLPRELAELFTDHKQYKS